MVSSLATLAAILREGSDSATRLLDVIFALDKSPLVTTWKNAEKRYLPWDMKNYQTERHKDRWVARQTDRQRDRERQTK